MERTATVFKQLLVALDAIAPVAVTLLAGFAFGKKPDFHLRTVTSLALYLASPCLTFHSLYAAQLRIGSFGLTVMASALVLAMNWLWASILFRGVRVGRRGLSLAAIFPNTVHIAYPLLYLMFGEEGLSHAVVFSSVNSIALYSVGVVIAGGRANWKQIATMPALYGALLGYTARMLRVQLPHILITPVQIAANAALFLLLISLGAALATVKHVDIRMALVGAASRLVLGLTTGTLVAWLLRLQGISRAVVLLQSCMPVALTTFIVAERFDVDRDLLSATIMVSTAMSLITIPLIAGLL